MNLYGYVGGNPVNRIDPSGLFSPVDVALGINFYNRALTYMDISYACGNYLSDSNVSQVINNLKRKIDLKAHELIGLKGETTFSISTSPPTIYVTSIYSFGSGNGHKQTAVCTAKGSSDGCCVSVSCKMSYSARDVFDDPVDLCQEYGVCGQIRNGAGRRFSFGLSCGGYYSTKACKGN